MRYPTEQELETIRNWDVTKSHVSTLLDFIEPIWEYGDWGFERTEHKLELHIGGWSGNEDIIGALRDNRLFWAMYWQKHERGGHYYFDDEMCSKELKGFLCPMKEGGTGRCVYDGDGMKIRRNKLDEVFSQIVRARAGGKCEYCGKKLPLQCSHFHGRRAVSTRYDLENCSALCFSCHQFLGEHPNIHTDWFKKRLGSQRFEELNIRAHTITKMTPAKKEALYQKLKKQLERL